jgi:hypothetical protein
MTDYARRMSPEELGRYRRMAASAQDLEAALLALAESLIAGARLTNASTAAGDVAASGVAPASADVAVLRHVLAHNGPSEQRMSTTRPLWCGPAAACTRWTSTRR